MLTIVSPPPVITSPIASTGVQREFFSYQITATNTPFQFAATGLPDGLNIDTTSGLISGYPTQAGSFSVQLSAQNTGGTVTATLSLLVNGPVAPVISNPPEITGVLGGSFSYQITASSHPTSYTASGLPTGLTVDGTTGLITGIPTQAGAFNVTLQAGNEAGTSSVSLIVMINQAAAPIINSALTANGSVGQSFFYQITASNSPVSFSATNLPAGLSFSSPDLIAGTPTQSGQSTISIAATNAGGTGIANLVLTVLPEAPVITSQITQQVVTGQAVTYQVTASASPSWPSRTDSIARTASAGPSGVS